MSYAAEYQRSIEFPEAFWKDKARALSWFTFPETILSKDNNGIDRWFADGQMNTAYMALDYHVENGRGEQKAHRVVTVPPLNQRVLDAGVDRVGFGQGDRQSQVVDDVQHGDGDDG